MSARRIPDATVGRLPLYLRVLNALRADEPTTVSSERLAELAGVNAAKVRKDLSYLGSYGTRGVGYDVEYLCFEISTRLGLANESAIAVVGLGNLGRALASHKGFRDRGFPVVALYDADSDKIGTELGGLVIAPADRIGDPDQPDIAIGVIATPPGEAQRVVDQLVVDAGVRAILNFAPTIVTVPEGVTVREVDLSLELQVLSFYHHRDGAEPAVPVFAPDRSRTIA